MTVRRPPIFFVLASLTVAAVPASGEEPPSSGRAPSGRTIDVTGGAAPGYVDDELCGRCHQDLYQSFQEVGMARSFYPPSEAEVIEDFDAEPFYHAPSRRYYQMRRSDGGGIHFRRYQLDPGGEEINVFEQDVDWILGSGHRSRTYLYRVPGGEPFQLPLAWYTQEAAWGMAPGYDNPEHQGVQRRVQSECMFCHNAYPDVPAGSDAYLEPQLYPQELPHGIGCQRCHGPGGEHVREGFSDEIDFQALAASIVHPADLDPELRRDVCHQCHMQPSVALMGIRRFGRGVYSFRPGEPLGDYLAQIDVEEEGAEREERFEINHHPYRLEQSACFQQSGGEFSCLTCHDPHRKVPVAERPAHYRRACLGCHQLDDCDLEEMTAGSEAAAPGDCAGCHMSQHRPKDVVRVVMTDHLIRRRPGGEELLEPLAETTPVIVDARLIEPGEELQGALGEVYRALAVLRAGGNREAVEWLEKQLPKAGPEAFEPYLDLGRWRYKLRRLEDAEEMFRSLMEKHPRDPQLKSLLAVVRSAFGDGDRALALAREALDLDPRRADSHYNLGRMVLGYQGAAPAIPHLREAVRLRPNMVGGWFQLGVALEKAGEPAQAAAALRRVLEIEPSYAEAYRPLFRLLIAEGERIEADRYRRHAIALAAATQQRSPPASDR